jgi:hypothetical protein
MSATGTILVCPRCGHEHRRRYVSVDFLNDARREAGSLREALVSVAEALDKLPAPPAALIEARLTARAAVKKGEESHT